MNQAPYIESGAEWIGRLPGHWQVKPMFSVVEQLNEKNTGSRVQNLLSLSYGKIVRRDYNSNFGLLPESFDTYQIVKPGDIVLRLLDLQNDHVSLRVGLVHEEGIVTSAYVSIRPTESLLSQYAAYLLHAYDIKKVFYSFGGGCRQSMGFEDLKRLPIPFPPTSEQHRIAAYLDEQTAKIDRLMDMRRRQMDLLKEQRASLIQQAVTRGLNPNAPMKDSGIPWLGEIPVTWNVKRIKHIALFVQTGSTPPSTNQNYYDHSGNNWYGPGDFSGDLMLGASSRRITALAVSDGHAIMYKPPVVLIVGIGASVGKVGIATEPCFTNQQVNGIALKDPNLAAFFGYFLSSYSQAIAANANHATLPIFNQTQTKNFPVPVPASNEQHDIAEFINKLQREFDIVLASYSRQLTLLAEYRASLIHECVTGQRLVNDVSPVKGLSL